MIQAWDLSFVEFLGFPKRPGDASLIPIHYSPGSRVASRLILFSSLLTQPLHILQALSFVYDL